MKKLAVMILMINLLTTVNSRSAEAGENFVRKSPSKAGALSLGFHLVPVGLGAGAFMIGSNGEPANDFLVAAGAIGLLAGGIFGPGVGQMYAGNQRRFWEGIGFRTCLGGVAFGAWCLTRSKQGGSGGNFEYHIDIGPYIGLVFLIVSGVLLETSAIRDIAGSAESARDYNFKHGFKRISLSPTFDPRTGTPGLRLAMSI